MSGILILLGITGYLAIAAVVAGYRLRGVEYGPDRDDQWMLSLIWPALPGLYLARWIAAKIEGDG